MLAVVISLLFGLAAFAALAVIRASLVEGMRSARHILAELSAGEVAAIRPVWQPRLAAA